MEPSANQNLEAMLATVKNAIFNAVQAEFSSLLKAQEQKVESLSTRNAASKMLLDAQEVEIDELKTELFTERLKAKHWEDASNTWTRRSENHRKENAIAVESLAVEKQTSAALQQKLKDKDAELQDIMAKRDLLETKLESRKRKWETVRDVMESEDNLRTNLKHK